MSSEDALEEATEVLQQLGLKEYEAKCFVGLSRLSTGTAKRVSEITDVPRTRIYDAVRVLEAQGLVEVQHSSPQQFRAVPIEEAIETLRNQYEDRVDRLRSALSDAESLEAEDDAVVQEVWAMTGASAIANRTRQLVEEATEEVVIVIGQASLFTEAVADCLRGVGEEVDLLVGTVTETLQERVTTAVPDARTFVSGLEWLANARDEDEVAIGRLVLVDRSNLLISTIDPATGEEHAVYGSGFKNGLVVIARRLMAQGLIPARDPGQEQASTEQTS